MPHLIPVKVAVRCRPLSTKEIHDGCQACVDFVPNIPQIVIGNAKSFTYDFVYNEKHEQSHVFNDCVAELLDKIIEGFNVTILAYGQTGSGKTYTMGSSQFNDAGSSLGIIPRAVENLYEKFNELEKQSGSKINFRIKNTFVELYKEDIKDLLCSKDSSKEGKEKLTMTESSEGEIKIMGVTEIDILSFEHCLNSLKLGSLNRSTGATAMNLVSSRSHAIFSLIITQESLDEEDPFVKTSKIHFVDLAGSERIKKTQAEGERLKEGININKGLLCLGNVISALGEESRKKDAFVPYRDSKLTRLLQDSLGGNSHTLMIACVSPADYNLDETISTLRYADRARKIKNKPIVNLDANDAEILRLRSLNKELRCKVMQFEALGMDLDSANKAKELNGVVEELQFKIRKLQNNLTQVLNQCLSFENEKELVKKENEFYIIRLKKMKEKLKSMQQDIIEGDTEELRSQCLLFQKIYDDLNISGINDELHFYVKENLEEENPVVETEADENGDHDDRQSELASLIKTISTKEDILKNIENFKDFDFLTLQNNHEDEIKKLQKEKEELLEENKQSAIVGKLSKQRRQRLKELEDKISVLLKKLSENEKQLKIAETNKSLIKSLKSEIMDLKKMKITLVKKLKEDGKNLMQLKNNAQRELNKVKVDSFKKEMSILKQKQKLESEKNVLKRKYEEISLSFQRYKNIAKKASTNSKEKSKKNAISTNSTNDFFKEKLCEEMDFALVLSSTKSYVEQLQVERGQDNAELKKLELKLIAAPQQDPNETFVLDEEKYPYDAAIIENMIEELKKSLEIKQFNISDLQNKICEMEDQYNLQRGGYEKNVGVECISFLDKIASLSDLRDLMQWFYQLTLEEKLKLNKMISEQTNEIERTISYTHLLTNQLDAAKNKEDALIASLRSDYDNRLLFILKQSNNASSSETEVETEISIKNTAIKLYIEKNEELESKVSQLEDEMKEKEEEAKKKELANLNAIKELEHKVDLFAHQNKNILTSHNLGECSIKGIKTENRVDVKEKVILNKFDNFFPTTPKDSEINIKKSYYKTRNQSKKRSTEESNSFESQIEKRTVYKKKKVRSKKKSSENNDNQNVAFGEVSDFTESDFDEKENIDIAKKKFVPKKFVPQKLICRFLKLLSIKGLLKVKRK